MNPSLSRDDWTVHGSQIARESLGADFDPVGWRDSSNNPARVQDSTTQRWKSPAHDQPFMWDTDFGSHFDSVLWLRNVTIQCVKVPVGNPCWALSKI
ncbi:hypothetical protein DSL72_007524 [Monilinia vaccinii-corymbosi]|uniref:Uncharacterized protein n=1 Tax=Monilinia vaccinii-corymbosi TaxID=61207 RepID=A0A8A3PHW8_9HELO|nr:hypothetical protein DSL72_007524 [Monilinia vaccinii-corymbosi]